MTFNTNQIILDGFTYHDDVFTMFLASGSGLTDDQLLGRAVTLDTTEGTVKVAANDEPIYGRIFQVEDRTQEGVVTVSVETKFRKRLKKQVATSFNIGDTAIGEGSGLVKPALSADPTDNLVLAVATDGSYVIVHKF